MSSTAIPPTRDRHDAGHAATICHSCQRKGRERIILRPPTAKIYPDSKTLHLNSPPFRSHAGYHSESRHFCAVVVADGGRHLSRRGSSRGKRRQTGSRASSGRVIIIQSGGRDLIWDILLSPFFPIPFQRPLSSSLISDNSSKRVSEPGTEKDRVMMKTTGGRRSVRLRASDREWSGVGTSTWTPKMVNDSDRFAVKEEEVVRRRRRPRATKG